MADQTRHDLALSGCAPEPLIAYLKALGVLRLLSEQKDPDARGWWKNDVFWLRSLVLFENTTNEDAKRNALATFFLGEYKPTPIVAPWNAGSGFYLKWDEKKRAFKAREASDTVSKIECSTTPRLQPYRNQILAIKNALKWRARSVDPAKQIIGVGTKGTQERWSKKKTDQEVKKLLDSQMLFSAGGTVYAIEKVDKDKLLSYTRSSLVNDEAIEWIDAAFVIRTGRKKNRTEAPLLGSGGNIGNSDFSARLMEMLSQCVPLNDAGRPTEEAITLLGGALFGSPTAGLYSLAVDQFDPGRAGGANMHQGLEAGPRLNPWDYILMIEGALVLQGASSKRLGSNSSASVFPFAVESTPAGFESSGLDTTRGEQWLPLWERAASAKEIRALLSEGRSEVGGRNARNGVDFARAAASLGVDRGIKQFVRIQYQARFGDNYLANTLGRVDVVPRLSVDLLREADPWLNRFRSACFATDAPPRFATCLRRIDSAVFEFCKYGGARLFQEILVSLGTAERALSTAERFRDAKNLLPLAGLSSAWMQAGDDESPEFVVARAIASVHDSDAKIARLRANLEPVLVGHKKAGEWYANWAKKDRAIAWNAADLAVNLARVLQRRLMDGARAGCECLPLASRFSVPLGTVAAFVAGELDDERIEELIWGLMLINDEGSRKRARGRADDLSVPPAYALLKLLFLSRPLVIEGGADGTFSARPLPDYESGGVVIRPEPAIVPLLGGSRLGEACAIAMRRLRASGLDPMPKPIRGRHARDGDWRELDRMGGSGIDPQRLAAALLIPISDDSVSRLVHLIIRGDEIVDGQSQTVAETTLEGGTRL